MQERLDTKREFALLKRAKSFTHAWRGIWVFLKATPNAWIEVGAFAAGICLGLYFDIPTIEWLFIIFAGGMVLAAEAFNTAFEIDINLTSPEYHPYARDVKDVAAGATLLVCSIAAIIYLIIFIPYLV